MTDVTIPADSSDYSVGDHVRVTWRDEFGRRCHRFVHYLDYEAVSASLAHPAAPPTPPTLREKVAEAIAAADCGVLSIHEERLADAVLAVIADEMAKCPLYGYGTYGDAFRADQRDADVAWLRGES